MPTDSKIAFLKAFQNFSKYSIIWKSSNVEEDVIFFKNTSNVFVQKWTPQSALLSNLF